MPFFYFLFIFFLWVCSSFSTISLNNPLLHMKQIFFSTWHLLFNFVYSDYWNPEILNFNAAKLIDLFTLVCAFWVLFVRRQVMNKLPNDWKLVPTKLGAKNNKKREGTLIWRKQDNIDQSPTHTRVFKYIKSVLLTADCLTLQEKDRKSKIKMPSLKLIVTGDIPCRNQV